MKYYDPLELKKNSYDIVIIGSGAAGTALASTLSKSNKKILILEAGKQEWKEESQEIYSGYTSGYNHGDLQDVRIRQLGGSTNCWGGACVPFDPVDFELTENGRQLWPIKYDEIRPYYVDAGDFYGIGDYFDVKKPPQIFRQKITNLSQKYWLVNDDKKLFIERYDKLVLNNNLIDLCLCANVTDIKFESFNKISTVIIENYAQYEVKIKADKVVLAAGGLETTRLLLNWSEKYKVFDKIAKNLGLYYSPHIDIRTGSLIAFPGQVLESDSIPLNAQTLATGFFTLDFKQEDQQKFLNSQWTLHRKKKIIRGRRFWKWPRYFVNEMSEKETKLIKYLSTESEDGEVYDFVVMFDQTPTSESVITLSNETDRFNLKKIKLHFHIKNSDVDKIKNTYLEVARLFGKANVGRVNIGNVTDYLNHNEIGNSHHTGTVRMAQSPEFGCVDHNLKIFGVDNLWVCSSSVFPTPSQANPTFTIMALALRLGKELLNENY